MFQLNEFQTPEKIMSFFDPAYKNFFEIVFKKQAYVSYLTKFFFLYRIFYIYQRFFFQFIPLSSPHNYYNELINKKKQQKPEKKDYV